MRKKKGVCGICFLELDDQIVACPACSTKFHKDHLAAWLRLRNNQCPHCRDELPQKFIEQLTPKTREEKEHLDSLEYLFGDMRRYNKSKKYIIKREAELQSMKQAFVVALLLIFFAIPFLFYLVILTIIEI